MTQFLEVPTPFNKGFFPTMNFIALKNCILERKILEGKIAQNDPRKKHNFLKNGRLSAKCCMEIDLTV